MGGDIVMRRVDGGGLVFREGDPADGCYVVLEGTVRIYKERGGHETTLATLKQGEIFGEMALLDGAPRSASAAAGREGAHLRYISREEFEDRVGDDFVRTILRSISQRLRTADEGIARSDEESALRHEYLSHVHHTADWAH
jgi:CRP/FNR family transcriptional regulator